VGLNLRVVVEANLSEHSEDLVRKFERAVAASPQIVHCVSTTGQADYIMTVLINDIQAYERFLHDTIFRLPGVTHVRSSIVLKEIKQESRLPVAAPAPEASKPRARRRSSTA
jgi:Lrp/AsnC family transcriptional regulator, leucine-responsive regulatory protein